MFVRRPRSWMMLLSSMVAMMKVTGCDNKASHSLMLARVYTNGEQ
ncbi:MULTISPECIES: hypothetical protein [Vibrio]|nr:MULTISPECIES: hypothetical protein [Vibrio]MDA0117438.1 hypothetical protein [Vibrio sp. T11.5]